MTVWPLSGNVEAPPAESDSKQNRGKSNNTTIFSAASAGMIHDANENLLQPASAEHPVVNGMGIAIEFVQDEEAHHTIIKVYQKESGELIRQIPQEEVLSFLRGLAQGRGILLSRHI